MNLENGTECGSVQEAPEEFTKVMEILYNRIR